MEPFTDREAIELLGLYGQDYYRWQALQNIELSCCTGSAALDLVRFHSNYYRWLALERLKGLLRPFTTAEELELSQAFGSDYYGTKALELCGDLRRIYAEK